MHYSCEAGEERDNAGNRNLVGSASCLVHPTCSDELPQVMVQLTGGAEMVHSCEIRGPVGAVEDMAQ